jgi:hypothetical protein
VGDPVAGELLGGGNGLRDVVDEGERCRLGVLPVRRRLMVTTKTCSPAAGLPFQPLVRSNNRRPMTTAAMSR